MSLQGLLQNSKASAISRKDKVFMTANDMGDASIEFDKVLQIQEWFVYSSSPQLLQLIELGAQTMQSAIKIAIEKGSQGQTVSSLSRSRGIVKGVEVSEYIKRAVERGSLDFDKETFSTYHFKTL